MCCSAYLFQCYTNPFDTHPGASPSSSDRRIAQPILPEFEGYPQHLPALSSAPLPQWKRNPMPGGGAPVVSELPSWTVNNGEWLMVRGGGRTCSPGETGPPCRSGWLPCPSKCRPVGQPTPPLPPPGRR